MAGGIGDIHWGFGIGELYNNPIHMDTVAVMVIARNPSPPPEPMAGGQPELITEATIGDAEQETIHKVSRAISALEKALAEWDASEEKPEHLEEDFDRYRGFLEALGKWERKMLLSAGQELDFFTRVDRLREFVEICQAYS